MSNGLRINASAGPNVLGGLQQGFQIRGQRQDLKQQQKMDPLLLARAGTENELLQEELKSAREGSAGAGERRLSERDKAKFNSVYQGALQLQGISSNQGKLEFLNQRRQDLIKAGLPTGDTDSAIALAQQGRFDELSNVTGKAISFGNQMLGRGASAGQRERAGLLRDLQSEDAQVKKSASVALGLAPRAVTAAEEFGKRELSKAQAQIKTQADIKSQQVRGKSQEAREQGYIDSGLESADSMETIAISLDLLDEIDTGGFESAQLRAKQTLGIESADEAQLANALGVSVLQQLKPIFGSAFTAAEGDRLERLSAGFGKSTDANKRILSKQFEILERSGRRAIKSAEARGDTFAAEEIRSVMDKASQIMEESKEKRKAAKDQGGKSGKGEGQVMVDADGNRARVFADGTFEEL